MPKVETSLNKWGKHITTLKVSNGDSNTRFKRELPDINKNLNRRRVIKKLVRVQALTNATLSSAHKESFQSEEGSPSAIMTRRYRKRLRIKKKKRLLSPPGTATLEDAEPIRPTPKPRKRIVITRKRLIPSTNQPEVEMAPSKPVSSEDTTKNILAEPNYDDSYEDETDEDQVDLEDDYQDDDEEDENYDGEDYYDDEDGFTEAIPIRNEQERESEGSSISEMKYFEVDPEEVSVPDNENDTNDIPSSEYGNDHQDLPHYDPLFPELSESSQAPALLLKTTVLSSTELLTKTVVQSRLRTYTFVITRVSGTDEIVTSTTEVRPQITTAVLTEPVTVFTTLTLLDLDPTETLTDNIPTSDNLQPDLLNRAEEGRSFSEEARYNLATRVMSNGVEVIVAGDKTASARKPDPKRFLSADQKHVTLKPSTLTDQVLMLLPQETSKVDSSNSDQFVTKTCLTTFTYITTYLEGSTTTVSSHEQVVSNVATEAKEKGKILPTPTVGVTLTQNTNLSVGTFHTTYTYLNTILDGEQPLVISSEHTVANTVTAPNDYLSLLQPSEPASPAKDTNTYYSTIGLEKTLFEGDATSVISTKEIVTQVVITESLPLGATSVMTSYIALDMDEPLMSTDILKTHFVTYTYYSTSTEDGKEVVKTDVSTASDVVTEQLYVLPKRKNTAMKIQVAKTYLTTFTYYTTLLREGNQATSTIVSSRTSVVENLVTETISPGLVPEKNLAAIGEAIAEGAESVVTLASLMNGNTVEITAFAGEISPSKVMPIDKTAAPVGSASVEVSSPSVITGSTIVFVDDDPFTHLASTPVLKPSATAKKATKTAGSAVLATKREKSKQVAPTKVKGRPVGEGVKEEVSRPADLLGLGSLNMDSLQALTPVISAMAGLISTNLKSNRRQDVDTAAEKVEKVVEEQTESTSDAQNRSPIYIPVRGLADDFEIAESQNIANFDWIEEIRGKNPHEMALLNGGIAISPGEIITANSDVIVGRPGRIGPRVPSIPLHGPPVGMKPPPIPKQIPAASSNKAYVTAKDDYIGPPPPPYPQQNPKEKFKHATRTLGSQNRKEHFGERVNPFRLDDNTRFVPDYNSNEVNHGLRDKYEPSYPLYDSGPPIDSNPLVLPEIIERSTGQPLLVNIQPSQVAFVNIPFNRTTALIYGGSTEPHRSGQYFDDPSPYPEPEFSAIRIGGAAPQFVSAYPPAQKQVKVREQTIHVDPDTSANQKVAVNIRPTKPRYKGAAPISFELVNQAGVFNAHVINHGQGNGNAGVKDGYPNGPRWTGHRYRPSKGELGQADTVKRGENNQRFNGVVGPQYQHKPNRLVKGNEIGDSIKASRVEAPANVWRPKPTVTVNTDAGISETMLPPPPAVASQHGYRRPLPIPLGSGMLGGQQIPSSTSFNNDNQIRDPGRYSESFDRNRIRFPEDDEDAVDGDVENGEDGVFQESNSRPLLPGEVPIEILKSQAKKNESAGAPAVNKIPFSGNRGNYIPVASQNARPFSAVQSSTNRPQYVHTAASPHRHDISNLKGAVGDKNTDNKAISRYPDNSRVKLHRIKNETSSQKPVLIFIDENDDTTKDFFHHKKENAPKISGRPSVTSLPIDVHLPEKRRPSQTETPFVPHRNDSPTNEIVQTEVQRVRPVQKDLNTGEVTASDMEILRPPPTIRPAEGGYPAGEKVPESTPTSRAPLPSPSEKMVPPPPQITPEVIGMSPPPRTAMDAIAPSANGTVFSLQIDTPQAPVTVTEKHKFVRTLRPYTRRPSYRTTSAPTATPRPSSKRPVYPLGDRVFGNRTTELSATEANVISPSPTVKSSKPSMQVIIGRPHLDPEAIESSPGGTTEIAPSITQDVPDLMAVESGAPTEALKNRDFITHHAGNEVKAVDESTSIDNAAASTARSKLLVPTKFVTYTLTSTVTVTETTVIESLGQSPSTMTVLVTKTERSTVVDTVTEVRTLVKPTNVVETVTATVASSLYPADAYGSPYPSVQVKPTVGVVEDFDEEDLEDFIIRDGDYAEQAREPEESNDSILIVMTDKNTKKVVAVPDASRETQGRDEVVPDKVSDVRLGGIFISSSEEAEKKKDRVADRCDPECLPSKNELCQKSEGSMRCHCRPGFARMFPDRPCLPTYTFNGKITLERIGKDALHFYEDLKNSNTSEFLKFAHATREALDRMVMQSDLRDIFHGVQVHSFEPVPESTGIVSKFYLQLSDNIEENRLEQIFQKYLQSNNNSLGGTDIFASPTRKFKTEDFDECSDPAFHDCSENSRCFNLRGTYTCSCKEGFSDLSENMLYPGRICSADLVGCDKCSFHGTCYTREGNEVLCECFQWYTGQWCQINLKVLLIALVTLGAVLLVLLLVCIIMICARRKPRNAMPNKGIKFLPQRNGNGNNGTMDRRAMIQDTSSEDSRSETNETLPYVQAEIKKPKETPKKTSKVSLQIPEHDQKDRSLTVMIPRAKYHHSPATANLMNYTTFDARKPSVPTTKNEAKLLSYLDAGPSPSKSDPARKFSNAASESAIEDKSGSRKASGALVSAGFEVSATVVNNMGTLETTRGTEADRSENATLIQRISADLLSSAGSASQFNTLRKSLMDDNIGASTDWLDIVPRVMAVSEARSFDETTIPPPVKVFRNEFDDSKPSSQHQNDEANTMAERDLGSTFLLPHTHLYKPERRESDASGFESL